VAVVQYTFTHKQYTEYGERNIHNNKKKNWEVRAVPRLCDLYPGIGRTTEEKARENLSYGSRKVPRYPGGSSPVHIYTKQYTEYTERKIHNNKKKKIGKFGPCPVFGSYTLAFALQLRKKHGKTSVMVVEKCPDIPVAVQYTFTHKQYTERHSDNQRVL
jgi:hypothetical protein